jgi:hypothetical protein
VSYNLVVDWERATSRWFEEESRGLIKDAEEGDPDGAWVGA